MWTCKIIQLTTGDSRTMSSSGPSALADAFKVASILGQSAAHPLRVPLAVFRKSGSLTTVGVQPEHGNVVHRCGGVTASSASRQTFVTFLFKCLSGFLTATFDRGGFNVYNADGGWMADLLRTAVESPCIVVGRHQYRTERLPERAET